MQIIQYQDADHRLQVIQLWAMVFAYRAPHNDPAMTTDKKRLAKDELFFVAKADAVVFRPGRAGHDGHRGLLYALAVHPNTGTLPWQCLGQACRASIGKAGKFEDQPPNRCLEPIAHSADPRMQHAMP